MQTSHVLIFEHYLHPVCTVQDSQRPPLEVKVGMQCAQPPAPFPRQVKQFGILPLQHSNLVESK